MPFLYTNLVVFQEAKSIHRVVCDLTRTYPAAYFYLRDQLRRAALSVALNLAEGSGKGSKREFRRYTMNAIGSLNELAAGLEIALGEQLISDTNCQDIIGRCEILKRQIGSLANKLKSEANKISD